MKKFTKLLWGLLVMAGILVPLTIYAGDGTSQSSALAVNETNVKTYIINGVEVTLTTRLEIQGGTTDTYAIVYTWDLKNNTQEDGKWKIPAGSTFSVNSELMNGAGTETVKNGLQKKDWKLSEGGEQGILTDWFPLIKKTDVPSTGVYALDVIPTVHLDGKTGNESVEKYNVYLNLEKKDKMEAKYIVEFSDKIAENKDGLTLSYKVTDANGTPVSDGVTVAGVIGFNDIPEGALVNGEAWNGNVNVTASTGDFVFTNMQPGQQVRFWSNSGNWSVKEGEEEYTKDNGGLKFTYNGVDAQDNWVIKIPENEVPELKDTASVEYPTERTFTLTGKNKGEFTFKLKVNNPDDTPIYKIRLGAVIIAGNYVGTAPEKWPNDGGDKVGDITITNPVIGGDGYINVTMPVEGFPSADVVAFYMKSIITVGNEEVNKEYASNGIQWDQKTNGTVDPNKPAHGEAVNTVKGTIWALRMKADDTENTAAIEEALKTSLIIKDGEKEVEDDAYTSFKSNSENILWRSPLADVENPDGTISGGYSSAYTLGRTWKGELKNIPFTISNDKDGYIFGELDLTDIKIPSGLVISAYINDVPCPAVVKDNKASFETKYGYVEGKIVSFHFSYAFPDGTATTLTYQYTITGGGLATEALTFDDLFSYESNHYSQFDVKTWNKEVYTNYSRENIPADCDWAHTARPVDIDIWESWKADEAENIDTENVTPTYWNPNFKFRVFNQASKDNEEGALVPVGIALEFENGTVIPANFVPRFALQKIQRTENDGTITIEPTGKDYSYNLTTLGSVVNMFAGTTDPENYPAREVTVPTSAPQKAEGDEAEGDEANEIPQKFENGDYWLTFKFDYTSIVAGRGYSQTRDFVITLNNSDITTGIEGVDVEAAEVAPVYFNLQGMRVEKPAKGQIVIMVQGKKATKVMF